MRDQTCTGLRADRISGGDPLRAAGGLVKGWTPLRWGLAAAVLACVIGLAGQSHWVDSGGSADVVGESVPVLVASRYIPPFTVIRRSMTQPRSFPRGLVPPGALKSVGELGEKDMALWESAVAIPEGQPLTRTVLSDLRKRHGMASVLRPGQVAVSFAVDAVRGVGGWIQPGDTIALFSADDVEPVSAHPHRASRLLFSSVRVVAVDRKWVGSGVEPAVSDESGAPPSNEGVLTVVLNAVEAARLVEAREKGHISVLLRALGDDIPWVGSAEIFHE